MLEIDKKKWILSLLFSISILIILVWKIDSTRSLSVLLKVKTNLVLLACTLSMIQNFLLGSFLLHTILRFVGFDISYLEVLFMKVASYPIRTLLPAKGGDFAKSIYLKRKHNLDLEIGVGSVFLAIALVAAAFTIFLFLGFVLSQFKIRIFYGLFILPFLFVSFLKFERIQKLLLRINFLKDRLEKVFKTLKKITFKKLFLLLAVAILITSVSLLNYYIILSSIGIKIPLKALFTFIPILYFVTNLPSVGGLGFRESFTVILFSTYAPASVLFAGGFLFSLIDYFLPALVGTIFLKKFLEEMM